MTQVTVRDGGHGLDAVEAPGQRPATAGAGSSTRGESVALSGRRGIVPTLLLPVLDSLALAVLLVISGGVGWFTGVYACGVLVMLAAQGLHRLRICLRVCDQVPRIVAAAAVPLLVLTPWAPTHRGVFLGLSSAGVVIAFRVGAHRVLRAAHRRQRLIEPTLIVGSGQPATETARVLGEHPELGLRPVGLLDRTAPAPESPLPLLGDPAELAGLVERHRATRVIVCPSAVTDEEMTSLLRACRPLPADVCVLPRLPELGMAVPRGAVDEVWGIPLLPLRRSGHTRAGMLAKRVFDLVVGTVLVTVLAPLILMLSLVVRIGGTGTAFFRQVRITGVSRLASMIKIRTTVEAAQDGPRWTVPPEECSRFGRWLRATHFDELPQLVNVLRGEMSLVGPRPERPHYAMRFARRIPHYDDRHRMPGGMTGWAQVHGLHGDTSIPERARFDNQYIEYWSPWLDTVIVIRTLAAVLTGIGRLRFPPRGGTR